MKAAVLSGADLDEQPAGDTETRHPPRVLARVGANNVNERRKNLRGNPARAV